jgi:hypothetical protein
LLETILSVLITPMRRRWILLLAGLVALASGPLPAQTLRLEQIDLVHRQLSNPEADCTSAVKRGDLRFIALDREASVVPGAERYRRLVRAHGTKFVKQPFWLFPRVSDRFSFNLRAIDYARRYNSLLVRYLAAQQPRRGRSR